MREAVICSPVRTPVGRYGGIFRDVSVETLSSHVIEAILTRTGLDPAAVDECILATYPNAEVPATGRVAALKAGLPVEVPGLQLDRRCGSGLQSICMAAMEVQTGVADVVIAGGVESMSQVEFYSTSMRWGPNRGSIDLVDRLDRGRITPGSSKYPVEGGVIETAENLRRQYSIPREEQDEYALRSHQRAVAAIDSGRFEKEIAPVPVADRKGNVTKLGIDEHPRRDTTMESLARLRPGCAARLTAKRPSRPGMPAAKTMARPPASSHRANVRKNWGLSPWRSFARGPLLVSTRPIWASGLSRPVRKRFRAPA